MTKNADISITILVIELDLIKKQFFFFPGGGSGQNVIILGAEMSSSVHVDNKGNHILILGKSPTQRLVEHSLTEEKKYSINFTVTKK